MGRADLGVGQADVARGRREATAPPCRRRPLAAKPNRYLWSSGGQVTRVFVVKLIALSRRRQIDESRLSIGAGSAGIRIASS
jgi:hypothetical protein